MNEVEELLQRTQQIEKTAKALASSGMVRKTVMVHPQLSKTPEEAKKLAEDWKAREEKQLMDNLQKLIK